MCVCVCKWKRERERRITFQSELQAKQCKHIKIQFKHFISYQWEPKEVWKNPAMYPPAKWFMILFMFCLVAVYIPISLSLSLPPPKKKKEKENVG